MPKILLMMTLNNIGSLDLDKMPLFSNKILVVCNGIFQDIKNPLKIFFFFEYKMGKEFPKFGDIEIGNVNIDKIVF